MSKPIHAVSLALVQADAVLLIQRAGAPFRGSWTLPGGRIEPGETPEAALRREIEEELGLELGPVQPLVLFQPGAAEFWLQVYCGTTTFGEIRPHRQEIAGWRWVRAAETSNLQTTPGLLPIMARAISSCTV